LSQPSQAARDPFRDDLLAGRQVVLGICGSIAAYKGLAVASRLVQAGVGVDAVLTRAAGELLRPLALQALTHRPVVHDLWAPTGGMAMDHLALARAAEALIVAPVTADTLARLAMGRADDALTTTALASRAPLLLAPAMEPLMWDHPATTANVTLLAERGATFVGPVAGRLASGKRGLGRMAEPEAIEDALRLVLGAGGPLAGRCIAISAGPTREAVDPVRFLSNHASGRLGIELARRARDLGASVRLVLGPTALTPPVGIELIRVETAAQMCDAVLAAVLGDASSAPADALLMSAAVADYRPTVRHEHKLKKGGDMDLALQRTTDVLVKLDEALEGHARRPLRIGFAAETGDLVSAARGKLERKKLDMVVANRVPASFGDARVEAQLVTAAKVESLPPLAKDALAGELLRRVHGLLEQRGGAA
jgi:phosphopantothenoylcysteine decarboxylase/phosphopantothenate--cysteine ligase